MDFFAYSPASSVNVTVGLKQAPSVTTPPATGPEIKYTVPGWNGVDQQEDFMVTKSVDLAFNPSNLTVQLNFKHALSRIVFKAQNQNKNKTYLIKELALSNLKSKGTLNILDSIPDAGATFPHVAGAYDVAWKGQSDSVTYKVDLGNTNVYVPATGPAPWKCGDLIKSYTTANYNNTGLIDLCRTTTNIAESGFSYDSYLGQIVGERGYYYEWTNADAACKQLGTTWSIPDQSQWEALRVAFSSLIAGVGTTGGSPALRDAWTNATSMAGFISGGGDVDWDTYGYWWRSTGPKE
ncbi:hypothetical protein AGMMS49525_18270 [Bacteroidia bacterium]|nr:hypothetical protein AGMMS49525_18270 [Bacteroidia bacterium]